MKCLNCGAECNDDSCYLCGTNLYSNKNMYQKFLSIFYSKWYSFILPPSSLVLLIIMGIMLKFSTVNGYPIVISEWITYMLIIFVFFIIPYDIIRWLCWGKKTYIKKTAKRLEIHKTAELLISKSNRLADTINTTTNRATFETSLAELKRILTYLIQYEKYGVFSGHTPKQDLEQLLKKEGVARKAFEERLINESFACTSTDIPKTTTNYDSMEGHEFEYFCADLLEKNSFVNVEVTQGSGDHGIDILAEKDDVSYAIQCKCYSSNIGNAAIQQALAGKKFYNKDIAVVLTNQYFTTQAKEEAKVFGVKLWDRDKLNNLIEQSNL